MGGRSKAHLLAGERRRKDAAHHRAKRRENSTKRAARGNRGRPNYTNASWLKLRAAWGARCAYCGRMTNVGPDHMIPLSRGGEDRMDNVVPCCRRCNSRKGFLTPLEFIFGVRRNQIRDGVPGGGN